MIDDFISSDDSPRTIDDVLAESELPPFDDNTTDNNFDDDFEIIANDMDEYFSNVITPYLDEWNDDNTSKNGQKKSSSFLEPPNICAKNFVIDTRRVSVKIEP